ncbi:MAG: DsbA family protein [Amphiplicatus sp.]
MTKTKLAIGAALAGATLFGAIVVGFVNAGDRAERITTAFDAAQEDAIREIVRDYLLKNPEVMIESLNAYSARERQARARDLLDSPGGFTAGANPEKAKVAVIELFDYHCGYCKRAMPLVQDLVKSDPAVKVVFREFPILRPESEYAAKVALASRAQGKYQDLYFAFMDASGVLTKERVEEIAKSKGVDFAAIEKALADPSIEEALDETHAVARDMRLDGTPVFIVASLDGDFLDVIPGFAPEAVSGAIAEAKKATKR